MLSLINDMRGNRSRLYLYIWIFSTLTIALLLLLNMHQQQATPFKLLLVALMVSAFISLFWGFIYAGSAFRPNVALVLNIIAAPLFWLMIYPATANQPVFLVLPTLLLFNSLLLFGKKERLVLISVFTVFLLGANIIFGLAGYIAQPGINLSAQTLLFIIVGGGAYWLLSAVEDLEKRSKQLEQEQIYLKKRARTLEKELKISRQQSEILHKNVRRRDIEIQNILNLSDQMKMRKDTQEVLMSFILTAIGQLGSSYAVVMIQESKEQNYLSVFVQKGLRGQQEQKMRIYLDSNLVEMLNATQEPMLINQIPREYLFPDEIKIIDHFNDDLICPIFHKEGLIGLLIIGKKISGADFTKEDINLISIVANQAAFVLEQTQMANDYKEFYSKTMRAMLHSLESRYKYARGHNVRTANFVNLLSRRLGLSTKEVNDFSYGALLHDIGKVVVHDKYLFNPERFSDPNEPAKKKILEHTLEGSKILKSAGFNPIIVDMALHHHEFYNGKGFPHNIGQQDLAIGTKILSVCNAFDAMTSDRPYRKALTPDFAKEVLRQQSGKQFDPEIVFAFLDEIEHNPGMLKYH